MKHLNALCASASLLLGASSAVASEASADLFVKGSIAPGAACNVVIGSTLKLPPIKRKDLNANPALPTTDLEEQRVPTAVHCAQPTRFAFVMREAGGQDMNSEYAFTMRLDDSEKSPGKLLLLFDTQSTKIDNGVQGYATGASSMDGLEQATWGPATSSRENLPITNGRYAVGFVKTADSTEAPVYITDLSVKLLVRPWIKPVNELDLSADIGFSSDLGLEISYF